MSSQPDPIVETLSTTEQTAAQPSPQESSPEPLVETAQPLQAIDWQSLPDAPGAQEQPDGGIVGSLKHYWGAFDSVLDESAFAPIQGWLDAGNAHGMAMADEMQKEHPYRASVARGYYETMNSLNQFLYRATTPKQVSLVLAAGEYKAVAAAANLYFAIKGSQDVFHRHLPEESWEQDITRRVVGAVQAGLSVMGLASTTKEALHTSIQQSLGISGNLAQKVSNTIEAVKARASQAAQEADQISTQATASEEGFVNKSIPVAMSELLTQAQYAALVEKQRVDSLYEAVNEKLANAGPVTDAADLRAEITNTLNDHGIPDSQIPKKVFNYVPAAAPTAVRSLTARELQDSVLVKRLADQGVRGADLRSALVNLGYAPKQIDAMIAVAAPGAATDAIDFETLVRVKNDVWDAGQTAMNSDGSDTPLSAGLKNTYNNLNTIADRYVAKRGAAAELKAANQAYAIYKRGVGSGLMNKLLEAQDVSDQGMMTRVNQVLSESGGEQVRSMLKSMGVDVSPLRGLVALRESTDKAATAALRDIQAASDEDISSIQKANEIVKGKTAEELAGKSTQQIRADAVKQIVANSRKVGIMNPGAYISAMTGAARLMFGSTFGIFSATSGGSRIAIEKMLASKSFQDWIIQDAAVQPSAVPAVRTAIAGSYDILKAYADKTDMESLMKRSTLSQAVQVAKPQPAPKPKNEVTIIPRQAVTIAR